MKTANISYVRAHFSELLDAVRHGQTVEILDRTVPIARLVPIRAESKGVGYELPPAFEKLRRAGVIKVGKMRGVRELLKKRGPKPTGGASVLDALLEERRNGR